MFFEPSERNRRKLHCRRIKCLDEAVEKRRIFESLLRIRVDDNSESIPNARDHVLNGNLSKRALHERQVLT